MSRTSHYLVPFVLCAMGMGVCILSGCRREEAPPPHVPESYMKDPVFRKGLDDRRAGLSKIAAERSVYVARMEELIKEHGEDEAKLKQIPEWNDLMEKVKALNARYEAGRQDQLKYVRERIAPKKPVSK